MAFCLHVHALASRSYEPTVYPQIVLAAFPDLAASITKRGLEHLRPAPLNPRIRSRVSWISVPIPELFHTTAVDPSANPPMFHLCLCRCVPTSYPSMPISRTLYLTQRLPPASRLPLPGSQKTVPLVCACRPSSRFLWLMDAVRLWISGFLSVS